jgi:hypothetical protein
MGYWSRTKLLKEERGIDDILRSLLRRRASLKPGTAARESVVAAIRYWRHLASGSRSCSRE